ncbi:MAG: helix-turn-helix domain-containing protein, partial [Cyanobacteria bacterium P01_H01_bin.152]
VGNRKLEQYGQIFVDAINAYCNEQGVQSPGSVSARPPTTSQTRDQTLALYQAGHSLDDIARLRNLRRTTIVGHLSTLLAAGAAIDLNDLVAPERQVAIRQAIATTDSPYLNAVRDRLGQTYSYDEIRLVQGAMRGQQTPS